jgi:hypothetical protein
MQSFYRSTRLRSDENNLECSALYFKLMEFLMEFRSCFSLELGYSLSRVTDITKVLGSAQLFAQLYFFPGSRMKISLFNLD